MIPQNQPLRSEAAPRPLLTLVIIFVVGGLLAIASVATAREASLDATASVVSVLPPTNTLTPLPSYTPMPSSTPWSCDGTPTPYPTYGGTPASAGIVQRQVSHCFDDAYVALGSGQELNNRGEYVRMGALQGQVVPVVQYIDGFLFRDVRVPAGAQIITATLRLMTWYQSGTSVIVDVAGQLSPQASDFSAGNPWPNQRPRTAFRARWTISSPVGPTAESPDLAGIVQEIVGQEGWQAGNDLALLIVPVASSQNIVDWQAFDFFPPNAAQLAVRYEMQSATATPTATATVTPSATPTAAPTATPTATATNTPVSGLTVRGQVRRETAFGAGVPDVLVQVYLGVSPWPATGATTDGEGRYDTGFVYIPGDEMITVKPVLDGNSFDPPLYYWRHYNGNEIAVRDFIIPGKATSTPSATASPTATMTPTGTSTPTVTPTATASPTSHKLWLPLMLG